MSISFILSAARGGAFGTPENPNRGSSGKGHFWNAYFGVKSVYQPTCGHVGYEYVKAGRLFRKEMDNGRTK